MKMTDPTKIARFQSLTQAAGKIARLVPAAHVAAQSPDPQRDNLSLVMELPAPTVILNSTVRQAISFLFAQCDTVQIDSPGSRISYTFTVQSIWLPED